MLTHKGSYGFDSKKFDNEKFDNIYAMSCLTYENLCCLGNVKLSLPRH